MPDTKSFCMRVRVKDGKPREPNQLKGKHFPYADVHDVGQKIEFVICVPVSKQLDEIRTRLAAAELEEVPGGATDVPANASKRRTRGPQLRGRGPAARHSSSPPAPSRDSKRPPIQRETAELSKKPYGFVPLLEAISAMPPIWHDGTSSEGMLSGEIRLELTTLTPMLVGWERRRLDEQQRDDPWCLQVARVPPSPELQQWLKKAADQACSDDAKCSQYIDDHRNKVIQLGSPSAGWMTESKALLYPLRAPWGMRPVLIPGDTIKGLLRHELGALLGAPMERVGERSYSYRPNSMFAENADLIPRIARVPEGAVAERALFADGSIRVQVPTELELLASELRYDRDRSANPPRYRFDPHVGGAPYRGGQGAGDRLNSRRRLHRSLEASPATVEERVTVSPEVIDGYLHTLRHMTDLQHGHFSERHPDLPERISGARARARILAAAATEVFQPGDLIWVEWDKVKRRIVSFGWHYYYRWAYQETVRLRDRGKTLRAGLVPTQSELQTRQEDGEGNESPLQLTAVRRLFGYTGDSDGSRGIGRGSYSQLMGRISVNAAVEVVSDNATESERFLPPTFLRELGMPRPSAVEYYLKQPHWPNSRPGDAAALVTYGDAAGYDSPGDLAGRKFYLDRGDVAPEAWQDDSPGNRLNERSTLAIEASRRGRQFRFTLRFRDLVPRDLVSVLLALCPHQFSGAVGGGHKDGYCSKLGYARPLGWGSVQIEVKELYFLTERKDGYPTLAPADPVRWFGEQRPQLASPALARWLEIHRRRHPDAANYRAENGQIYTFHAKVRARHTRARRYLRNGGRR